jgi:tRNA 2-thiouridine synthesizing protein A
LTFGPTFAHLRAMSEDYLDLRGLKCPLPVLRTKKALPRLAQGETLVVACTDPMSVIDIPHLVQQSGAVLVAQQRAGDVLTFHIQKGEM